MSIDIKIMTPIQRYRKAIESGEFQPDLQQEKIMLALQDLYEQFIARQKKLWHAIKHRIKPIPALPGLYIWGSVGAGKTWLMDLFYDSLPAPRKMRMHFHHFLQQVHAQLKQLQGQRDPLKVIAKHFAQQTSILCFDEFFVADITDAMILGNLLAALFKEGVTLVTTSNVPPDLLYRNGLQRDRFLPAIALIKEFTQVIPLQNNIDYRLRELTQAGVYFYPLNQHSEQQMQRLFQHLTHGEAEMNKTVIIYDRPITTIAYSHNIVWFDFAVLCHTPRSQLDYLEIAATYDTVFLSNIPSISERDHNSIRYLINLIDIFYDQKVKLIISAAIPIAEIYLKGDLQFEFQRTCSRLLEMQSEQYLRMPHVVV